MNNMDFSENIQFEVLKRIIKKNAGIIRCDLCGRDLTSISECNFVHIVPADKGGKQIAENCQLLCSKCNLAVMEQRIQDFLIEKRTEELLNNDNKNDTTQDKSEKLSKEKFDSIVGEYVRLNGDIQKKDFIKVSNHLPSLHYVSLYYGNFKTLKESFGIKDLSLDWNRETIKKALLQYVGDHGNLYQKELTKSNGLPSLPCILRYYPEYSNFTEVKKNLCHLSIREQWTEEKAINVGKEYVKKHRQITTKDLRGHNGLPAEQVISKLFGSINKYQLAIGSELSKKNAYISKEEISKAVDDYFRDKERVIESMDIFYSGFPISRSVINKRYGYFEDFCKTFNIKVLKNKKAKYSRSEIDGSISLYMRKGNTIPLRKELSELGLPSAQVILRFYENWKDPFLYYQRIYKKIGNNE